MISGESKEINLDISVQVDDISIPVGTLGPFGDYFDISLRPFKQEWKGDATRVIPRQIIPPMLPNNIAEEDEELDERKLYRGETIPILIVNEEDKVTESDESDEYSEMFSDEYEDDQVLYNVNYYHHYDDEDSIEE